MNIILYFFGYNKLNIALVDCSLWWKTYNGNIIEEISHVRGRMSGAIKKNYTQDKWAKCELLYVDGFVYNELRFTALLIGNFKSSAESRLQINHGREDENDETQDEKCESKKWQILALIILANDTEQFEKCDSTRVIWRYLQYSCISV